MFINQEYIAHLYICQKKPRVYCSLWPNWTIYVQNGSQHPYFPHSVHMDILPQNRHIASFIGHVRHAKSPFSVHGRESSRVESDLSSVRSPKRFETLASPEGLCSSLSIISKLCIIMTTPKMLNF